MAFAINAAPVINDEYGSKFNKTSLKNVLSNNSISDIHSAEEDTGLSDFYASYDAPEIPPPPSALPNMEQEHQPTQETKLNYILDILEQQKDIKTHQKKEEIILYFFLGLFIIYILNSFVEIGKYSR
jgi:hypothetical protein